MGDFYRRNFAGKIFFALLAFFSASCFAGENDFFSSLVPEEKSYALYVEPQDWGAAAYKVVVNCGKLVADNAVFKEDFEAGVYLSSAENSSVTYGPSQSERNVTDAYLSDGNGMRISGRGKFVALEFEVSPEDSFATPFVFYPRPKRSGGVFGMKITNEKLGISVSKRSGLVSSVKEKFSGGECVSSDEEENEVTLSYTYFVPQKKSGEKIPLIVFLHGSGEGGSEQFSPLLNSPIAKLAEEKIQSHFKNGAAVLVPVCPTNWLVSTTKDVLGNRIWVPVDIKGTIRKKVSPVKKIFGRIYSGSQEEEGEASAKVSYYTKPLKDLIDSFLESHDEIDGERIFLGGSSAGGYMVLNMVLQNPKFFRAAFPICEAFPDGKLSDGDIDALSEENLWFTVSKNDGTINPENHTLKTYGRLKNSGAENLFLCTYEKITDMNGYKDEDGNDYEYPGHFSWVYVLNDFCFDDERKINLFDWLSNQR